MWNPRRQEQLAALKELLQNVDDLELSPGAAERVKRIAEQLQTPGEGRTSFVDFLQEAAQAPNVYLAEDGAQSLFGDGAHCGGTQFAYQKEPHRMFDRPVARVPE